MTKKRFVNKGKDILQYGEWWCSAGGEHCADVIATAINELIEENEQLKQDLNEYCNFSLHTIIDKKNKEIEQLKSENKRLTDKLNKTALELVDECISQGKATEISEMSYREFLDYRAENGKPMELQL